MTTQGKNRAKTLAQILSQANIGAIYSTNFVRTQETVNNTAHRYGLSIQPYSISTQIVDRIMTQHVGETVLVAGHSDTVPEILRNFGVSLPPSIGNQFI